MAQQKKALIIEDDERIYDLIAMHVQDLGFDTVLLICHFLDIEVDWGWLRLITEIVNFE